MTFRVSAAPSEGTVGGETGQEILFSGVRSCGAERLASAWACAESRHRGSATAWGLGWGSGECRRAAGTFLQASGGASVGVGTEESLRVSVLGVMGGAEGGGPQIVTRALVCVGPRTVWGLMRF